MAYRYVIGHWPILICHLGNPPSPNQPLFPFQFIRQGIRVVQFAKRLDDGGAVYSDSAIGLFEVDEIPRQTLDIAVENDAHEFTNPIDHRSARVASNDVGSSDEIQRRR